ncbi:hypothetical protein [Fodinicola feengrottensis]|uniref:hypothetical protein n=1 Tax=Fodinicola feengrottensis TaxID=435914 RepID=UPI0013D63262|nr:hypothetical protein [Fodinicola feengrottensis]
MTYIAPPPLALPVRRPAPDRGLVTDLDPDVLPRQAVPAGRPGPPLRTLSTDPGWAERLIAEYTQPGDLVVNLDGITALAAAAGRLGRRSINIAATEAHLNALCRLRESALPGTRRAIMRVRFCPPGEGRGDPHRRHVPGHRPRHAGGRQHPPRRPRRPHRTAAGDPRCPAAQRLPGHRQGPPPPRHARTPLRRQLIRMRRCPAAL